MGNNNCYIHVVETEGQSITNEDTLHVKKIGKLQGRRKQSPDGQAQFDVGSEAVNNSRAKRAAKIWTLVFLAVRRRSHCTSASNWDKLGF